MFEPLNEFLTDFSYDFKSGELCLRYYIPLNLLELDVTKARLMVSKLSIDFDYMDCPNESKNPFLPPNKILVGHYYNIQINNLNKKNDIE